MGGISFQIGYTIYGALVNLKQAVAVIKKRRPTSPQEFREAGIVFEKKPEGVGAFREVMKVKSLPLVVKFPLAEGSHDPRRGKKLSYRSGKMHSTAEVRKIAKLSKIRWMRPYLPKVYYHDRKSGVLVMHWYKNFDDDVDALRALGRMVTRLVYRWTNVGITDIHEDNVRMGRTKKDTILIDLGY